MSFNLDSCQSLRGHPTCSWIHAYVFVCLFCFCFYSVSAEATKHLLISSVLSFLWSMFLLTLTSIVHVLQYLRRGEMIFYLATCGLFRYPGYKVELPHFLSAFTKFSNTALWFFTDFKNSNPSTRLSDINSWRLGYKL